MKVKRLSRVRITIKREAPWIGNIKSEVMPYQQEISLYKPLKDEQGEKISLKQEDSKDEALNKLKLKHTPGISSATQTTARETSEIRLKQEDTFKNEALGDVKELETRGYYYHCRICKVKLDNLESTIKHRRSVHNIKCNRASIIKYMDLEPNVHDENNFCRSCEITYSSVMAYRNHLTQTHHMVLKKKRSPLNDMVPDSYDPNFHCRSCKKTFSHKYSYRNHLKQIHDIQVLPKRRIFTIVKNTDVLPDRNDPTYYCPSCERQYKNRLLFTCHCRVVHNIRSPNKQQNKAEKLPDLHDPNFYCKVCDITHKNEQSYRSHCFAKHGMRAVIQQSTATRSNPQCDKCNRLLCNEKSLNRHLFVVHKMDSSSTPISNSTKPDVDETDNYCGACNRTYRDKNYFRYHVLTKHTFGKNSQDSDKKTKPDKKKSEKTKPDINDPNNYCRVCQHTFSSKKGYQRHLGFVHQMTMEKAVACSSDQLPDPLDPNWYCRVCKSHYRNLMSYRNHCKNVHRMKLMSLVKTANRNPNAKIDIYDPNHYRAKCDRKMKNRPSFTTHLKSIHKMKLPRENIKNPEAAIDPNDPNFYCAKCERRSKNRAVFVQHLRLVHDIKKPKRTMNNPDAVIDKNDPNMYCAQCERCYPSMKNFKMHLLAVHQMQIG